MLGEMGVIELYGREVGTTDIAEKYGFFHSLLLQLAKIVALLSELGFVVGDEHSIQSC